MALQKIVLQNFRSYSQKILQLHPSVTIIVGPNTAGKTNLVEAIMMLSSGKSVRALKDNEMIRFEHDVAWIKGLVESQNQITTLEVMIAQGEATVGRLTKKYLINGIAKSRTNFVGNLPAVLFRPEELDIIVGGPSMRREFLNDVLEQVHREYRAAKLLYDKALRQRNALLDLARETGRRNHEQFQYWNGLLITNGDIITTTRENFIQFINDSLKDIIKCTVTYDKSIMSQERLLQYENAEIHAGVTLVGPQRDDFFIEIADTSDKWHNAQHFGSRGQQRLIILQLKMLHINYIEKILGEKPLLVLDDIFSELDEKHISLVMDRIYGQQVIMTTTHKEFINKKLLAESSMIELEKE